MHLILLSSILAALTQSWVISATPTGLVQKRAASAPSATCDLSKASMPSPANLLPPPSVGLTLSHVAIGRGTQNYSCADSTSATIPVQVGAAASLFNATCVAGQFPQLLSMLPGIAYKFPTPSAALSGAASLLLSGHHYFQDATTPFFDLNTDAHEWGTAATKKINSTASPDPTKDVPWLKLQTKIATGCTISEVYRINTMGGVAPATCSGQPKLIQVQYAAEYWFYAGGPGSY